MKKSSGPFVHVVGARPNFMKLAPVHAGLARRGVRQLIVHTGQHYDSGMSDVFFSQLGLSAPDINLDVGSKSHGVQTGEVMVRLEPHLAKLRPATVLVYGDVNSTAAAAWVAVKLGIRTAHVEAGLRSRDRTMPEEHNRIVADHLCDLLFTPSEDADQNLRDEGIPRKRVHRVGNVMVDTLIRLLPNARALDAASLPPVRDPFVLVTLHRPSNVDSPERLSGILVALARVAERADVLFPVHPRTRSRLNGACPKGIRLVDPLGYLEFLALQARASLVITDSGGVQEETTYLGVPCLTVRENTERPVTITVGTNQLVGSDPDLLVARATKILSGKVKRGRVPRWWDGRASERIADILCAPVR